MLRFFILLILGLIVIYSPVNAQEHICGGIVGDQAQFNKRLRANIQKAKAQKHLKNKETVYIPIKFHLAADSDGVGRINFSEILEEMCVLNAQFDTLGIKFYFKDGINEINHTPIYESPRTAGAISRIISEINREGGNAVNVVITQNADIGNPDFGSTLGFYNNVNDYVVVRKNEIGNGGSTLVHELGHLFSLNHPHYGWEDQPWDIEVHGKTVSTNTVRSSQSGGSVRVELVDRSNCEESGDNICDTPPDYNFGFGFDTSCPNFRTIVLDRNGDTIVPMQNNYMSYFLGCNPYTFTQQQADVIVTDVNSNKRSNIRTGYIPADIPIVEVVELVSPANNTFTEFFNGVALEWTDVEHAEEYYLNITGGGDDIRIITTQPIYYVTDLSPNTVYTWSVTPYTETGGCGVTKAAILRTNDLETSTIDPAIEGSISINPNPSFIGDQVNVYLESKEFLTGKYSLLDINGSLISHNQLEIQKGVNSIRLEFLDKAPGLYFFRLETQKGITTKKVLIQ